MYKSVCRGKTGAHRFIDQVCKDIGDEWERPYDVIVRRFRSRRTLDQNARMHAMWRELSVFTGHTDDEIKDWFKLEYGKKKNIGFASKRHLVPESTTNYTRSECSDMIEHIFRIGAEIGCEFSQ